ncbi:MAG: stage 0 sporulation protein [Bacilli bacterium]|nr:stage 0 sporulation protein [Bacilli bacterium]
MKIYGLVFHDNGKVYNFKSNEEFVKGDLAVVETDKGYQIAKVVYSKEVTKDININEIKSIYRKSTDEDYDKYMSNLKDAKEAFEKAKDLVTKLELDMRLLSANFTLDKDTLMINFVSDDRVDFRDLAKKLASIYKTRIELHQVGARDKAKEVCGIGKCGQTLCCSRFLTQLNSVTMNMAKNQNLALNPSKINGACGRLLCCLSYEDDVYTEYSKNMPKVGQKKKYKGKEGTVVSIDILSKKYVINVDDELIEVFVD